MGDNIADDALDAMNLRLAMEARRRGAHWNEIADAYGFSSPAAALKAVGKAMADATMRAEMTADQMRDEANLRLETLLREAMDLVGAETMTNLEGEPVGTDGRVITLRAIDEARRLIESQVKLNKLDKDAEDTDGPLRVEIVGIDPSDIL